MSNRKFQRGILGIVFRSACAIFLILTSVMTVAAQTRPPDAGILLQEQRSPAPTLPDRLPPEEKKEIEQPSLTDMTVRVLVKGFRFTGSYEGMATESELQKLVEDKVGGEIGFTELQQLAQRVTNYLREKKGFLLARAYLPEQDVTDGLIEIVIVSGRIDGRVRINLQPGNRIRPSFLEGIAGRAIAENSHVRMENLERAILVMNDLPGVHAHASLEPGDKPNTSRIIIDATEERLLHGVMVGDNYGDRYTGIYRGTGHASLYDPSGHGDYFDFSFIGAKHLLQGRAFYSVPLGTSGLVGNVSYTYLSYEIDKELSPLRAKGQADMMDASLSYPLLRSRRASVWSGLGFEYLLLEDEANNAKTRVRKLTVGKASLLGNFYDGFGGGGLTSASIVVTGGDVDLSGLESNKAVDAAGPGTAGGFVRGIYSIARLQRVSKQIALFGSLRGQFTSGNLDSSQKFILGGPTGVRAYPVGEAPADEGHAVTLEARYDMPFMPSWAATQLIGFFDAGWVRLHSNPWPGSTISASGRNEYILSGTGIGINVGKPGVYNLRASYAHKIGPNKGCNLAGDDSDNTNDSGRFWLQLVIWI